MNNGRPHTMRVRRRRTGAGCVERTDRVQLQRLSCAPVRTTVRMATTTRGNPDRGTPVPTTKPSGLPGEAARRLHPAARDCSLPRSSCPRPMCARSCRVHARQLHRCPPGLLHPRRTPRSRAKMPNMCSDDGAALRPTPGWERAARRLAAKARSRPTFPAIALSSSRTMA